MSRIVAQHADGRWYVAHVLRDGSHHGWPSYSTAPYATRAEALRALRRAEEDDDTAAWEAEARHTLRVGRRDP